LNNNSTKLLNRFTGMVYKRIIIKGRVQGVFFRASTKDKADELGLSGEVRNMPDGAVEVLVAGDEGKVKELIEWCYTGPPRAQVTEVNVSDLAAQKFNGFLIVRR
jgi:acylphosphatase